MSRWIPIAALSAGLALAAPAFASDVGYIYGQLETVDGQKYVGELRWGDEEAFWQDMFNATKSDNENLSRVDDDVLDHMRRRRHNIWDHMFHGGGDGDFTHVFAARFGDLKRIRVRTGERVIVELRNGEEMELDGGSNDVGATVTVVDPKLGTHAVKWRHIREVEFRDTPAKLAEKLGEPLYGTVRTRSVEFTGHIQWDNDECLSIDKLDGETRDEDVKIPFGSIRSIRKHRSGVMVTLDDGRDLYLSGTNDVDRGNRGVVVKMPELGSVKIGWRDFEEVTFKRVPDSGPSYASYADVRRLAGEVEARGRKLEGDIVYDLDETWDFELLQGDNGDTEYLIPFRQIARITPKGSYRSVVELRSGLTIELEDSQDVTRRNDGLLVSTGRGRSEYVDWRDVDEVRFR